MHGCFSNHYYIFRFFSDPDLDIQHEWISNCCRSKLKMVISIYLFLSNKFYWRQRFWRWIWNISNYYRKVFAYRIIVYRFIYSVICVAGCSALCWSSAIVMWKHLNLSAVWCHGIKWGSFCHLWCVVTRNAPLRKLPFMNGRVSGVLSLRCAAVHRLPPALSSSTHNPLHIMVTDRA